MKKYLNPINYFNYVFVRIRGFYKNHKSNIICVKFFGAKLLINKNEDVGKNIAFGRFEVADIEYLLENISDHDVFFDIGANIGAYSVIAAKKSSKIKVYAFEPIKLNSSLLEVSLALNSLENVVIFEGCVSNSQGKVAFSISEDSAYSSMIDTGRKPEIRNIECESTSVDAFCSEFDIKKVDVIKIDVEGAEGLVLMGSKDILSNDKTSPRLILIELFDSNLNSFGFSISKIVEFMSQYNYRPFIIKDGDKVMFERGHHNVFYNVFFEQIK